MDISNINFRLTQLYLEMARSVFTEVHLPEKKAKERILAEEGIAPFAGISFLITSVTVIYSYLALEAFANYHLYKIWEDSRRVNKSFEELKRKDPKLVEKWIPTYGNFFQDYGKVDRFENLKLTDLKDLDKRIKVICEAYRIRKIQDVDTKLWQEFKGLLEKARHFLVHPFPDPTKFQDMMNIILVEKKLGQYVQIAQDIIKHFYAEKGQEVPDWVEKNTLFSIKGFEYLHNNNCWSNL